MNLDAGYATFLSLSGRRKPLCFADLTAGVPGRFKLPTGRLSVRTPSDPAIGQPNAESRHQSYRLVMKTLVYETLRRGSSNTALSPVP